MNTKIKLKKIKTVLSIFILCTIAFLGGQNIAQKSNADSSVSILPVNKGGTGRNTFPAGEALIGNAGGPILSRGIDTAPVSGSNNLITSGAANSISQTATNAAGINNLYISFGTLAGSTDFNKVFILGAVPSSSYPNNYENFVGKFTTIRSAGAGAWPRVGIADIISTNYENPNELYTKYKVLKFGVGVESYTFELGYFVYSSQKYLGVHIAGSWHGIMSIYGYYEGSLPASCSGGITVCVGTQIDYTNAGDFTVIAASTF